MSVGKIIQWLVRHNDKVLHFSGGLLLALVASLWLPNLISSFVGVVGGLCKELYDMRRGGSGFNGWDWLASAAGACSAFVFLTF
jgi:hypothetical protein